MKHTISNQTLSLSIQQKGVEISSLKSVKSGCEYIWDANPKIWGSHAPVLFPIIGALKEGKCLIDGSAYAIPKHGIIRHNQGLELISKDDHYLEFQLKHSPSTLAVYPYQFIFNIKYQLIDNQLIVSHLVQNVDHKPIHFALGAHPAFKCPFNEGESYRDYFIEFENKETAERLLLNADGLLSGESIPYLKNSSTLSLQEDMFKDDALVFTQLKSREVSLKSKNSKQSIKVRFNDFPYLGLWAKPKASFICIEPWQGLTDYQDSNGDFINKDGLISLAVGETYKADYTIIIEED
jgi:galactose mutarotase-like enzyme